MSVSAPFPRQNEWSRTSRSATHRSVSSKAMSSSLPTSSATSSSSLSSLSSSLTAAVKAAWEQSPTVNLWAVEGLLRTLRRRGCSKEGLMRGSRETWYAASYAAIAEEAAFSAFLLRCHALTSSRHSVSSRSRPGAAHTFCAGPEIRTIVVK